MTNRRRWQPAVDEAPHAIPKDAAVLAASRQRATPEPPYLESEKPQRQCVHGYSVMPDVSTHHRLQPLACLGDGFMLAKLKLGSNLVQLRLQSFTTRLLQHRGASIAPFLYADLREEKEVERLQLSFSTPLPLVDRIRAELQWVADPLSYEFAFTTPRRLNRRTGETPWKPRLDATSLARSRR